MLGQDPRQRGYERTRWTLALMRDACPWVRLSTDGGMHRLLDRLGITYTRARDHIHSPDPEYDAKRAAVDDARTQAQTATGQTVCLLLDEVTVYRQPTCAPAWSPRGEQPLAHRSHRSDTQTRVVATLDVLTGQILSRQRPTLSVEQLVAFYQEIVAAYPTAERIYLVCDNWPVHFHADLLCALQPQETPFPLRRLRHWRDSPHADALQQWGHLALPIQLVPLPTYASWLNPIEKLWRKLRQDVTHLHPYADDLPALRRQIDAFLDSFKDGSDDLRRYVGLIPP